MQNFFIAATDTMKPLFMEFPNPFSALLRSYGGSHRENDCAQTRRQLAAMARDVERMQPGLASELRGFASRV